MTWSALPSTEVEALRLPAEPFFSTNVPGFPLLMRASAAGVIRRHRKQIGSPWRKLTCAQQALLVLAYLRRGETFAELAAGFGIGTATAWR